MIEIDEEVVVPAPPDQVWKVVSDPAEVVSCIQGAELGEAHPDGSFDGALVVRFSAVKVRFGARITLDLDEPERHGVLSARGRDGQGATRYTAHANFHVEDVVDDVTGAVVGDHGATGAAGGTRVRVRGEVALAGRLASVIEAGAGAVVGRMTRDFAAELTRRCTGEQAPRADLAAPAPAPPPPPVPVPAPARRSPWARVRAWWRRIVPMRQDRAERSGQWHG